MDEKLKDVRIALNSAGVGWADIDTSAQHIRASSWGKPAGAVAAFRF